MTAIVSGIALALTAIGPASSATAVPSAVDPSELTATGLSPVSRITGAKSITGRLAQTDPTLLGRTDSTPVNVVVKLDYDATASYAGDIEGLEATSPKVTGEALTGETPAEVAYETYTSDVDATFRDQLAAAIPSADAGKSLQTVYGGVAVTLPADQVATLLALPEVAAVQVDQLNQIQTDSSTEFIGAPTIWDQIGGQALAGSGVIFGDLDSGVWPEHPSFANDDGLGVPPPTASPRACDFGDNPLTPETDVFVCNNKLIGGEPFIDTYNAVTGGEVYPDSARDSDGHGTHTTTTAAGGIVESAPIFGAEHGPISGVAPGAWVISYKVCGSGGCYGSDSAAAVEQAILDGVDVINFSISGGVNPYGDVVELAFLGAYEAGILVAASAGNDGPGAGTVNHLSPWVLTVAASTQTREFQSTLTVSGGGESAIFTGSSITSGIGELPIVPAESIPGYDRLCTTPLPVGTIAEGAIVACQRGGNGRVQKGYNVLQGGAAAMILYNAALQDTETDNHWLPTVHLADGTDFVAFLEAHPGATGTFTDGVAAAGQGDVMAGFSSRGPGGQFLKPDVTVPGVQILTGHTPTPDSPDVGPPGEYFQAIAGTSMSSPHAAGAAILLKALHPTWTPGAIKSALMTTAITDVVKEDLVTPADPFDFGAGRIDLTKAGGARLVFDESATRMLALGNDPVTALDLNLPSVNVPTMPGTVTVKRTASNVSNKTVDYKISTTAPSGAKITVKPSKGRIRPGQSATFEITITSNAPTGQYFGEVLLTSKNAVPVHLPVAFYNTQGSVTLAQACDPTTIKQRKLTTCTVTASNQTFGEAVVAMNSTVSRGLTIVDADGASSNGRTASVVPVTLAGQTDAIPAIAPATATPGGGYLPLEVFGIPVTAIGDEEALNFDLSPFVFGGRNYSSIGVVSNGYVVLGGSTGSADIAFTPQDLPDPAQPNGVLAPYWSDLDGTNAPGIRVASLTDSVSSWVVVQWDVQLWGTTDAAGSRSMQVWIGTNGVEDISYEYAANSLGMDTPPGYGLTVGAENSSGTAGAQIAGAPTSSYAITSTPGEPGESVSYVLTIRGDRVGNRTLTSSMITDVIAGTTVVNTPIVVTRK